MLLVDHVYHLFLGNCDHRRHVGIVPLYSLHSLVMFISLQFVTNKASIFSSKTASSMTIRLTIFKIQGNSPWEKATS
jgi:hypothetical protein